MKKDKKDIRAGNPGINFVTLLEMKKNILIVDDDPGIRDIFKMLLEKAGYSVQILNNGKNILEDKYTLPDLFLIDRQLSGIDGTDICRYLKLKQNTKNIPIIMISASPDIETLSKKAGADNFIEKPFEMKYFLQMIERYINNNKIPSKRAERLKSAYYGETPQILNEHK